jgi:hypothetical protein
MYGNQQTLRPFDEPRKFGLRIPNSWQMVAEAQMTPEQQFHLEFLALAKLARRRKCALASQVAQ